MTIDEMKDMGVRRIRLELQPSLRSLGVGEDAYVVIDNVPADARLSAGYGNADRSWLVPASEFNQVDIVARDDGDQPVVLNVRVVSLDPNGESFASTIARFDIHIGPDGAISTSQPRASAASASPRSRHPALPARATVVNRSQADRYIPLVDSEDELPPDVREASHALVQARAAGRDDGAAARFARAMAKWQAQELQRWAFREAELVRRQRQELAGMAARLRVVEGGGREVSLDERWNSKFAELLTAQSVELPAQCQECDSAYDAAASKRSATRSR